MVLGLPPGYDHYPRPIWTELGCEGQPRPRNFPLYNLYPRTWAQPRASCRFHDATCRICRACLTIRNTDKHPLKNTIPPATGPFIGPAYLCAWQKFRFLNADPSVRFVQMFFRANRHLWLNYSKKPRVTASKPSLGTGV